MQQPNLVQRGRVADYDEVILDRPVLRKLSVSCQSSVSAAFRRTVFRGNEMWLLGGGKWSEMKCDVTESLQKLQTAAAGE